MGHKADMVFRIVSIFNAIKTLAAAPIRPYAFKVDMNDEATAAMIYDAAATAEDETAAAFRIFNKLS